MLFRSIRMHTNAAGSSVGFDPIGIRIAPGQVVRWVNEANVHTTTAYHPAHDRQLRIPQAAEPWDSGYLVEPGASFEITLEEPGSYDYFCRPHEAAGMVGRIVVGEPSSSVPEVADGEEGAPPPAALKAFPAVEEIMRRGSVPLQLALHLHRHRGNWSGRSAV